MYIRIHIIYDNLFTQILELKKKEKNNGQYIIK